MKQHSQHVIVGLLGIVFVTLKLCGVISWSWWWVTVPFWGGIVLVVFYLVLVLICKGVSLIVGEDL